MNFRLKPAKKLGNSIKIKLICKKAGLMIDFRSDTVTRPTAGMLKAMQEGVESFKAGPDEEIPQGISGMALRDS